MLFCAVLQQAWDDAFTGRDCKGLDRAQAISFLLDIRRLNPWRQQREMLCALAGIDESAFRSAVKAKVQNLGEGWQQGDFHVDL
jgi:hypothetical protein